MDNSLKETYNRIAGDWNRDHQRDDWWEQGVNKFISFLKRGDLVLDLGCGPGTKSKYLLEKGLKIIGVDFAEKMIEIAKEQAPGGTFYPLELSEVGQLKPTFDGIFMEAVIVHLSKKEIDGKLKKILTKLKSGGYFYVSAKEIRPGQAEEEVKHEEDYGYVYERFFSYFTVGELRRILTNQGLKIVYNCALPVDHTNWLQFIARKK